MQIKKRLLLITAAVSLSLILLLLALPWFFGRDRIRDKLSRQISSRIGSSVQVSQLTWSWLPLPQVKLIGIRLDNDALSLSAVEARIHPDWFALLAGRVEPGMVILRQPELSIKHLPFSEQEIPIDLSNLRLGINDGVLRLPATEHWPLVKSRPVSITEVDGRIRLRRGDLSFDLHGRPEGCEILTIRGSVSADRQRAKLEFDGKKIAPDQLIAGFARPDILPLPDPISFKGSLAIQGGRLTAARFDGELPGILSFAHSKKIPLASASAKIAFNRQGEALTLSIEHFALDNPKLALHGTVKYLADRNGPQKDPIWALDLTASDVDLTKLRALLLAAWGDNRYVKQTAAIVLGGRAGELAYRFQGTTNDFGNIRKMRLAMRDLESSIETPVGGLLISEAKGEALIEHGKLVIKNATARHGNSRGKNGSMVLGLADDDHSFILDVDLDADLAELPDTLKKLVDYQPFLSEMALFSRTSGRATGHLHLGDDLRDFGVEVKVSSAQGKGRYAPLGRDFTVKTGQMLIRPKLVEWQEVSGDFGPHQIKKTSGQIQIGEKDLILKLSTLDANCMLQELRQDNLSWLNNEIALLKQQINRADGQIELRDTSLLVSSSAPDQWQGKTTIKLGAVSLESPHLSEALKINRGQVVLSEKDLKLKGISASLLADPLELAGNFSHRRFVGLKGQVQTKGRVSPRLGAWLRQKKLIPEEIFPKLPVLLSGLTLDFDDKRLICRGTLQPEGILTAGVQADFQVVADQGKLRKLSGRMQGNKEEAELSLEFYDESPDNFLFSWKGNLSKKTADRLLDKNRLLLGSIAGDFRLTLPKDPAGSSFRGQLTAKNLKLKTLGLAFDPGEIRELRLSGTGKALEIKDLAWQLNGQETIRIRGQVVQYPSGIAIALDLTAPRLEEKSLTELVDGFKKPVKTNSTISSSSRLRNITGTINFQLGEFVANRPTAFAGADPTSLLRLAPFNGRVRLMRGVKTAVQIDNAGLCCLNAKGNWYSAPELGKSSFAIQETCSPQPRFEEVLPCLGYPQDLIAGKFSLTGKLEGSPEHWSGGTLEISSQQGRILRLKLLAKILSVVNITDLFLPAQEESGKHAGERRGFPYSELLLKCHINDNELVIDEAVIRGEGLNLFARGKIKLQSNEADLVVLIAPFKTIDAVIGRLPIIGKLLGGETGTILTFPVAVRGNLHDPEVIPLSPAAVGEGLFNLVKRTLLLPFTILSPFFPDQSSESAPK